MKKRITTVLLCLVWMAAFLLPVTAFASAADTQSYTLNIDFHSGEMPLEGALFRVWRVAEWGDRGGFSLTDAFADYAISLEDLSNDGLLAIAATLTGYVVRDSVSADAEAVTDSDGFAVLSGLEPGMYLVGGTSVAVERTTYAPIPSIVFLPGADAETEVTLEPKPSVEVEETETLHVLKIWREDTVQVRPHEIVVQLLMDGEVCDEVELNAENNWRYTWTELEQGHAWLVVEKEVPEGYTVAIEQVGFTITVTNTYDEPDEPDNPDKPNKPDKPDEPDLPQTGQLWLPVIIMLVPGCILLVAGVAIKTRNE